MHSFCNVKTILTQDTVDLPFALERQMLRDYYLHPVALSGLLFQPNFATIY
jgi:hypothetical protein